RLDACNYYMHDPSLIDNPRRTKGMPIQDGVAALNPYSQYINLHNMNEVKNIKSLRRIRNTLNKFPDTIALGEIVAADDTMRQTVEYIRGENRLHTAYNSSLLVEEPLTPKLVSAAQEDLSLHLEEDEEEMICLTMSTHDFPRARTRWAPKDTSLIPAFERMLVTLLPTLRGIICFYHGEELGLTETDIPDDEMQDPFGIHFHKYFAGRDGLFVPLSPWDSTLKNLGFTEADKPWLRMDPTFKGISIQEQEDNPESLLHYFRKFLKWRNRQPALKYGDFDPIEVGSHILSFIRKFPGQRVLCVFNLSEETNFYLVSCRYGHPLMSNGITSFRVTNLGNGDRTIEMEPFGFAIFEREF
ncbi:MAG: alpha-glucosidase, partial [Acaryochloridaceae cyanobacterium RL_2_7]|nr:alpha-glucosidase [Acaryochloridaceae cyanobacterium RL_2_7]